MHAYWISVQTLPELELNPFLSNKLSNKLLNLVLNVNRRFWFKVQATPWSNQKSNSRFYRFAQKIRTEPKFCDRNRSTEMSDSYSN